jgi:hypothetical protein
MSDLSSKEARQAAMLILEKLVIHEDEWNKKLVTKTHEEYSVLLRSALSGIIDDRVVVGRSGIFVNNLRVSPPPEHVAQ